MKNTPRNHEDRKHPETFTYNVPQAAKAIGIGQTMCWRLIASGELRARRIGRRVVITAEAIEKFLDGEE